MKTWSLASFNVIKMQKQEKIVYMQLIMNKLKGGFKFKLETVLRIFCDLKNQLPSADYSKYGHHLLHQAIA